jgi:hypothetical protein
MVVVVVCIFSSLTSGLSSSGRALFFEALPSSMTMFGMLVVVVVVGVYLS